MQARVSDIPLSPGESILKSRFLITANFDAGWIRIGGKRIFALLIATASGQTTCSEQLGYGDNEFVPWQAVAIM